MVVNQGGKGSEVDNNMKPSPSIQSLGEGLTYNKDSGSQKRMDQHAEAATPGMCAMEKESAHCSQQQAHFQGTSKGASQREGSANRQACSFRYFNLLCELCHGALCYLLTWLSCFGHVAVVIGFDLSVLVRVNCGQCLGLCPLLLHHIYALSSSLGG